MALRNRLASRCARLVNRLLSGAAPAMMARHSSVRPANNSLEGLEPRVMLSGAPDLAMSVSGSLALLAQPGQALSLPFQLDNINGTAEADNFHVAVFESTNGVNPATSLKVLDVTVSALAAGSTSNQTFAITAPAAPGRYFFAAVADPNDPGNTLGDSNTSNNSSPMVEVDVANTKATAIPANSTWAMYGQDFSGKLVFNGSGGFTSGSGTNSGKAWSLQTTGSSYAVSNSGELAVTVVVKDLSSGKIKTLDMTGQINAAQPDVLSLSPSDFQSDGTGTPMMLVRSGGSYAASSFVGSTWNINVGTNYGTVQLQAGGQLTASVTYATSGGVNSAITGTWGLTSSGALSVSLVGTDPTNPTGAVSLSGTMNAAQDTMVAEETGGGNVVMLTLAPASSGSADLAGVWSFSTTVSDNTATDNMTFGSLVFDGQGGLVGGTWERLDGSYFKVDPTASTYTVNADGTITGTISFQDQSQNTLVLDINGAVNASKNVVAFTFAPPSNADGTNSGTGVLVRSIPGVNDGLLNGNFNVAGLTADGLNNGSSQSPSFASYTATMSSAGNGIMSQGYTAYSDGQTGSSPIGPDALLGSKSFPYRIGGQGNLSSDGRVNGVVSPDGSLALFASVPGSMKYGETTIGIVGKQGSGMGNTSLNATYNLVGYDAVAPGDSGNAGQGFSSGTGAITFNGDGTTSNASWASLESVGASVQPALSGLGYSVAATGSVTLGNTGGNYYGGFASGDGSVLAVAAVANTNPGTEETGLVLGFKQGSGMTVATLAGRYNFIWYGTQGATASGYGTLTVDGTGAYSLVFTAVANSDNTVPGFMVPGAVQTGKLSVSDTGVLTDITDPSNPVTIGAVSADGNMAATAGPPNQTTLPGLFVFARQSAPATAVAGNGQSIANGDTAPTRADFTDFANAPLSSSIVTISRTYTIQNSGLTTLNLVGATPVTITGTNAADFTVTGKPAASVAAGGSTTFTITFKPHAAGLRTATVNIATDDPSNPSYSFDIQGTGIVATSLSGTSYYASGSSDAGTYTMQEATTQAGSGAAILSGQDVQVLYTGYLQDGTVFDASSLHGNTPISVAVGQHQVIAGWDYGLLGAKVGESRTFIIPSQLAYGSPGSGSIPGNTPLMFDVQVVGVDGPTMTLTGANSNAITSGDTTPLTADGTDLGAGAIGSATPTTSTFSIGVGGAGALMLVGATPVTITGPNASQFTVTQPQINSGHTAFVFTVTYKPTLPGPAQATINIASNDPATPKFTFAVQGNASADLTGVFGSATIPATVTAGDKLTIPVTLQNLSTSNPLTGTANIELVASPDGDPSNPGNITLTTLSGVSAALLKNGSRTMNLTVQIPATGQLPQGTYTLLAKITPVTADDADLTDNVVSQTVGGQSLTINVQPAQPDLVVALGSASLGTVVPGNRVTLPVTITNQGTALANASLANPITVEIRASTDTTFDAGTDPLLATLTITTPIARGTSRKLTASFTVPMDAANFSPGSYYAVAQVTDPNDTELSTANNTAATSGTVDVEWQAGQVGTRTAVPLVFNDGDGTLVSILLTGGGTATLTPDGSAYDLAVTGSSLSSTLTIRTTKTSTPGDDGRFDLAKLTVGDPSNPADNTALGTILAGTTDVVNAGTAGAGTIDITGAVRSVTLGNVGSADPTSPDFAQPHTFDLASGVPAGSTAAATLNLGNVTDLGLTSLMPFTMLSVQSWQDSGLIVPDNNVIAAPAIGLLRSAGDFQAGLTLSGTGLSAIQNVLTSATIQGSLGGGTWDLGGYKAGTIMVKGAAGGADAWQLTDVTSLTSVNIATASNASIDATGAVGSVMFGSVDQASIRGGSLGSMRLGDVATSLNVQSGAGIASLMAGDVTSGTVTAGGSIASISAKRWQAGSITADAIASLRTTGMAGVGGYAGDFNADLMLNPSSDVPATANVLASASIAGGVATTGAHTWDIQGKVGSIMVQGTTGEDAGNGLTLVDVTSAANLNLGTVVNADVTTLGNVASLSAKSWQAGTINTANVASLRLTDGTATNTLTLNAHAVASLMVSGNLSGADLTFTQGVSPTVRALGMLSVGGTVGNSTIIRSAGNVGTVFAKTFDQAMFFVGVQNTVSDFTLPAHQTDFVASPPTITSLIVTGYPTQPTAAVFAGSYIAAGKIGLVTLPARASAVDTNNGGTPFGFATAQGVVRYIGPASSSDYISGRDSTVPA